MILKMKMVGLKIIKFVVWVEWILIFIGNKEIERNWYRSYEFSKIGIIMYLRLISVRFVCFYDWK